MSDINCHCNECLSVITINALNVLLTVVILGMNAVYAVWGLFITHSDARTKWKDYTDYLEIYLEVVSYSEAILIPLKILILIMVNWCCCRKSHEDSSSDQSWYNNDKNNKGSKVISFNVSA